MLIAINHMVENNEEVTLAVIKRDIEYIKDFIESADSKYASKIVEKLVYGMVGLILIAVVTALTSGVIRAFDYLL